MNSDQIAGKWKEIKGQVKQKWGKLTSDEINQIDGSAQALQGFLQQKYGWEKERAKKEVEDFNKALH